MGYIVAPGSENVPCIRAMIERHERFIGNATPTGEPDVKTLNWSPNEWRDQQHLHQQHHRQQQQQQQEQQLRQQQYQQRQRIFRYRQQQQQQQYHLQQQYEASRRWEHQQHYNATAKKTSDAQRVVARAVRQEAQAENGGAPPTSQTTSKPQSVCEYPVVLFASQPVCREPSSIDDELLDSMENGLLRKPVQEEMLLEKSVQDSPGPQQPMPAVQPRPCSPMEETGNDDMGVLGKDLVVAGGQVISAGGADVEEERPPPFWNDDKISVWWPTSNETKLEIVYARKSLPAVSRGNTFVGDGKVVMGNGDLVVEDGQHATPPLLQQQQELQAAPPQEPWPPPMDAEQEGRGAGNCAESGLWRLEFSSGCGSDDILSGGNGYSKESSGKGDDEEDTVDGRVWERVGIGTGARSRAFWGSEVALRRLTQRRRERVREK